MAPVTTALSCSSGLPFHSSRRAPATRTSTLALADGLLPGGQAGVGTDAGRDAGGLGLPAMVAASAAGAEPVTPTSLVLLGLSRTGRMSMAATPTIRKHDRCLEGAGPAPLAHLPPGHQPGLPHVIHAATAWRNSSDSVGGW